MRSGIAVTGKDIKTDVSAEQLLITAIREINEQDPPHILQGRFKTNGDLGELWAELHKAESEIGEAARQLIRMKSAVRALRTRA